MIRSLLVLLCCNVLFFANAQITIVSADLPTAPRVLNNAVDTVPVGFSAGPKGANQTWNFAGLVQDIAETSTHAVPSSTPYSSDFPGTTNAITPDNVNYGYFTNTSTAFTAKGLAGPLLGAGTNPVSVQFSPTFDLYRFPTNYNNNFSGNYGFVEEASGSSVGQPVDRVRLTFTSSYTDTIDGWGTIITPTGSYQALRQKRVEQTRALVEFKLLSFSPWSTADDIRDTITTYTWLAKETKGPVLTIAYNTNTGAISRITYSLIPPAPVADFSWTNPSGGLVQFTDLTTNNPTSWSWDYDDASALGTTKNPSHIYAANGTYNVCLTATNVTGSDTVCKNVVVTNFVAGNSAPVAVADSITTPYETLVTVNVINNDLDPNAGDVIGVSSVFGATNGTASSNGNGTVDFTPTAGFSGLATFQYALCDNASPSLCDTATVYVTVLPSPAFADFTYSDTCLTVEFTNTSTGYTGLVAWNFGDGSNSLGETVTHDYAEAGTYLACVTVNGATGTDSTCYSITVDTCVTIGIGTVNTLSLQIYPNPAQNQLTVVIPNGIQGGKLAIINNLGMLVKEITITDSRTTIAINELAAGIYHLTYTSAEGTKGAGKFVKQ
jgi:PKD repeat protein